MGAPRTLLDRVHGVVGRARGVTDHPILTHVARVGLIAYGAMHLLIGYLAARLAWGVRGADADQTGALQTVADGPGGAVLLWIIGLGMLALALWQAGEVLLWWHGLFDPEHRKRTALVCTKCLAKALVYAVLGITALLFALGRRVRGGRAAARADRLHAGHPGRRTAGRRGRRRGGSPSASTRWSAASPGGS